MSYKNWNEITLEDALDFYNGKKRPNNKGDVPVFGGNGILDYCQNFNSDGENLIIGRVGAYCGNVNYYKGKCWASDNAILAKIKYSFDSKFMYYTLINENLYNLQIGSSQPLLTQSLLKKIKVQIPMYEEQKLIANILSTLDEKIEVNNQINKTLEAMAQEIFKHWFIDFEFPNEHGEPFKSSGGEMVESELGLIPKGWKVRNLSELISVKYGKDHKKLDDGKIPVYGSGGIMRYVNSSLYSSESVLIPRKGTLNNIIYVNEPFWSVDTMFFTEMKHPHIAKFIYFFMKSKDLTSMNVGSAVPSMTTEILNNLKIITSSVDIMERYDNIVSLLFIKMKAKTKENNALISLRDTLLPKLMSGEIRVLIDKVEEN